MASVNRSKKRSEAENQREYLDNYKKFKSGKLKDSNESKYLSSQEGVRTLPKTQREQVKKAIKYSKSTKKVAPFSPKGGNDQLAKHFEDVMQAPPKDLYELQQRYPKAKPTKGTSSAETDSDLNNNPPKDAYELKQRMEAKKAKKKTYPDRRFVD